MNKEERDARIIQLSREGLRLSAIGTAIGLTAARIHQILKANGVDASWKRPTLRTLDGIRRYHREWSAKNRERIKAYGTQQSPEYKAYKRRYLAENRAKLKPSRKRARKTYQAKNVRWLREYKAGLQCLRCPENDPRCLDFHHRDPSTKKFCVSRNKGRPRHILIEEIAKCDVLCANCHRKLHYS